MSYKFLENIYADVAVEVKARSFKDLVKDAGLALTNIMVDKMENIEKKVLKEIKIEAENEEEALYKFLEELIFLKDSEQLVFSDFVVEISKNKRIFLEVKAKGEKIDYRKHECRVDVKAVTYHDFKVEKLKGKWYANIVFDV